MLLSVALGALAPVAMAQTNAIPAVATDSTNEGPTLEEVSKLLKANLPGTSAAQLDRQAVMGLIHELGPKVSIVAPEADDSKAASITDARVFDKSFGYIGVAAVTANLPGAFRAAYQQLGQTNSAKIKGLVLDLRFAGGTDYAAAAKVADCFLNSDHPLLNWQTGSARATLKADAITAPLAILINSETTGAAEALAAVLRDNNTGLIIGSQTPGAASVYKDFPLSNGSKLRVAVADVAFGDGKTLPQGVAPDIAINASAADEKAYMQNPFAALHQATTGRSGRGIAATEEPRLNEVSLIRRHKNGDDTAAPDMRDAPDVPDPAPTVADPALARALDLLKGLAVVQPNRPG